MSSGAGIMMGGGGMMPTINIPVVATMPMAGMMPIQQQTGGVPLQQQQQQTPGAQAHGAQTQTGGAVAPGVDGVKTLSIKL
jgi:hypothetical protein